jgi:hypothetical protein
VDTAIPPREETGSQISARLVPEPTGAAGLMVQPGLTAMDQTGLAERIRSRLAASRS